MKQKDFFRFFLYGLRTFYFDHTPPNIRPPAPFTPIKPLHPSEAFKKTLCDVAKLYWTVLSSEKVTTLKNANEKQ